jgi:hypothetical protein
MSNEKKSIGFLLFYYTMIIPVPLVIISVILKNINSTEVKNHITTYLPEGWNFEAKFTLLSMIAFICSIFIFFNIWAIALLRAFLVANPLAKEDPPVIRFLSRVLSNTIEQFTIFIPVLCYWTVKYCSEDQKHLVLIHGLIWVIGRVLFLLGYALGLFKQDLAVCRSVGLALTVGSTVLLFGRVFFNI